MHMTAKGKSVCQSENEVNIIKDRLIISNSTNDKNIKAFPQNRNTSTKEVSAKSCHGSHIHLIILGNTTIVHQEKILTTEYKVTDTDNAILSSKERWMTQSLVEENSSQQRKSLEKCRQIIKSSKRLRQRKQIGAANRKPNLFSYSLSMMCVLFSIVKVKTVVCSDIITWEVQTKPILFGETLELLCKISEKGNECYGSFQQWYGSKDDVLLCQNGKCRNEEKYTVYKNSNCSYSLLIHNLTIHDVNISYSCAFGLNEMKKGLMMKEYEFLKLPRNNSVISLVTTNDSTVDVLLKMDGIYPVPECTVKLKKGHERDITNMADISFNVIQGGIFYTYTMHIMHNVSKLECGSLLSVHCLIGSVIATDFSKELDDCAGGNAMNAVVTPISLVVIGVIIVISVVVVGVVCISVLLYHMRKKRQRNEGDPVKEKQPDIVVGYTSESCSLHTIHSEETDSRYTSESSRFQTEYPEDIDQ